VTLRFSLTLSEDLKKVACPGSRSIISGRSGAGLHSDRYLLILRLSNHLLHAFNWSSGCISHPVHEIEKRRDRDGFENFFIRTPLVFWFLDRSVMNFIKIF